jgi:sugar fermentation stimulation protein A
MPGRLEATFLHRPNRFLVSARLPSGEEVMAYLPNTGRLTELLVAGRRVVLEPADDPRRKTRFTVTRVWDGVWVSLTASEAPVLLADWVRRRGELPPFGHVEQIEREVTLGRHRIDLRLILADGRRLWIEVKSNSRSQAGEALLSKTPSERGWSHLRVLGELASEGEPAAVAFVVQREDAGRLVVGPDADPGWVEAVETAAQAGVAVLAYGCRVTPDHVEIVRELPVVRAGRGVIRGCPH